MSISDPALAILVSVWQWLISSDLGMYADLCGDDTTGFGPRVPRYHGRVFRKNDTGRRQGSEAFDPA